MESEQQIEMDEKLLVKVLINDIIGVREALKDGADASVKNRYGDSALLLSVYHGYTEIAKLLLDAGADVNAMNIDNRPALFWAEHKGNIEIIKMLKDAGAK